MENPQYTNIQPDIFMKEAQTANLTPQQFADLIGVPLPDNYIQADTSPLGAVLPSSIAAKQGRCTQEDYTTLPHSLRAQLIDGFILTSHPITIMHQRIISELLYQITTHMKANSSPCKCISSPVRLYLPNDSTTVLLPDLALLHHPEPVDLYKVTGLPSFIAEVTATGSTYLDSIKKLNKYKDAGIREYWIINWANQEVQTFQFHTTRATEVKTYDIFSKIPVRACDGLYLNLEELKTAP